MMTQVVGAAPLPLRYKVSISEDPQAPLALLVHGRAGNIDVMWTFRRCIPSHWTIVSVEAPLADPIGGWSWWLIDNETSATGAPRAAQQLHEFGRAFVSHYAITPAFMVGLGFSQGAGALSYLVQTEPTLFRGAVLLAGFVVPAELVAFSGVGLEGPTMATSIFMAHGSKDEVVSLTRAEEGCALLRQQGFKVDFMVDEVGHKVGAASLRKLGEWLKGLAG